jgi:predicted GIY-YIG superfamily endonuclease
MEMDFKAEYFVYILTNADKTKLKPGITTSLKSLLNKRVANLNANEWNDPIYLIYYEEYDDMAPAVKREAKLADFSQRKLKRMVTKSNPEWLFLEAMRLI